MLELSKKREEKEVGEFCGVLWTLKVLLFTIVGVAGFILLFLLLMPIGRNKIFFYVSITFFVLISLGVFCMLLAMIVPDIITYSERKRLYKQLIYLPISEEEINKYNIQTAGQYLFEIKHYIYSIRTIVFLGKTYSFPVLIDLFEYKSVLNDIVAVMESVYGQDYSYLKSSDLLNNMFTLCDSAESFDAILNDCVKVNETCKGLNEVLKIKLSLSV